MAERSNRTTVESSRSQMYGKKIPLETRDLAVQCAVYVQNRTMSSTSNMTPCQHWYKKKPDISHLRVFGCLAFVPVSDEKRRKLDPKATKGMMMEYLEESTSCCKIWDPLTRKLTISRDVIFKEESTMKLEGSDGPREQNFFPIQNNIVN